MLSHSPSIFQILPLSLHLSDTLSVEGSRSFSFRDVVPSLNEAAVGGGEGAGGGEGG